MTAWTSSDLPITLRVPGTYGQRRRRGQREPFARTDVASFVGFEPRVRRAGAQLVPTTGGPGHEFLLNLASCQVVSETDRAISVRGDARFVLSADSGSVPMTVGKGIRYTLAVVDAPWQESPSDYEPPTTAIKQKRRRRNVVVVASVPATAGQEFAPDRHAIQGEVEAVAAGVWNESMKVAEARKWMPLADVLVRRVAADGFRIVVCPAAGQRVVRCNDWREFVLRLGLPVDDGTYLGASVRAFFACGGSRCYITTIDRPEFDDPAGMSLALDQVLGNEGDSELEATGLARLLLEPEVSVVDVPDLHTVRASPPSRVTLPPAKVDACFRPCIETKTVTDASGPAGLGEPVYDLTRVTETQLDLVRRCIPHRWRLFLLLCPPITRDSTTGRFGPPGLLDTEDWRNAFHTAITKGGVREKEEVSVAGLYYPWLVVQESTGAPEVLLPPTGFAAGIIAARDLRRGPAVSPANERIPTAVGTTIPVDDEVLADLYDPSDDPQGIPRPPINLLRATAGAGVELWGARTLSQDRWLRFIAIRRGLSAVQRRCHASLQRTVFEPNTPALWMQATQIVLNVLLSLFQTGALRGSTPEEAFYVRCDSSVNPPESVALGRLVVEVGVAIAAPAEFIVFRLGREEGIVEVLE